MRLPADRDTNTNLLGPACDRIRHDSVQAGTSQQQREQYEQDRKPRDKALPEHRVVNGLFERLNEFNAEAWRDGAHRLANLSIENRRSERASYFVVGSHLSIDRLHVRDVEAAPWLVSHDVVPDVLCDTDYRKRELQPAVIEDRLAEWTPLA